MKNLLNRMYKLLIGKIESIGGLKEDVIELKSEIRGFANGVEELYNRGRASHEMFRILSKYSRDAVIVSRVTDDCKLGEIIAVDRAGCHMFNHPCEVECTFDDDDSISPLVGLRMFDLMDPAYIDKIKERLSNNNEKITMVECRRCNGDTFLAEFSTYSTKYQDQEVNVCIIRDVTYWQQREDELVEKNSLLYAVLENSPNYLVLVMNDLSIDYVNKRFCDRLGYTQEEVQGRHVLEFIREPSHGKILENNLERKNGSQDVFEYQMELLSKNNEAIQVEVLTSPVVSSKGEKFTKSVAIIRELTDDEKVKAGMLRIKKLGEIMLDMNFITQRQLGDALIAQRKSKKGE